MSSYVFSLAGATLLGWTAVVLGYEIPCTLGKYTDLDLPVVRTALRAEAHVAMKHRTSSLAVNKIIHELEELKFFYSQI